MTQKNTPPAADELESPAAHEWTVMIYLAGDNLLTSQCIAIMQELEAVAANDSVRVLACYDSNTPRPKGSRYLEINHRRHKQRTGMAWGLHDDLVLPRDRGHETFAPDFCNPAAARPVEEEVAENGLERFLDWGMENHRAKKHMLILFGHGTAVAGQTFLVDNNPPSFVRLEALSRILGKYFGGKDAAGKDRDKLNILACNNCVMNGIETAYEVGEQVEWMIGSQGEMLAVGWPYRKIIGALVENPAQEPAEVARRVLRDCARNLLDFSLMDRSLEQSLCELSGFGGDGSIIANVKALAAVLTEGLEVTDDGEVVYPLIRDLVRLARLEAQSYWEETFVDIFDFCELLRNKCQEALDAQTALLRDTLPAEQQASALQQLGERPLAQKLYSIRAACKMVLADIQTAVPLSYYIGPDLQYSHGLSIYFPWVLPEGPYFYEPKYAEHRPPKNYTLWTAFDIYKQYKFAEAAGWTTFLETFFRATLRNVRTVDMKYNQHAAPPMDVVPGTQENAFPVTLQKSSSDVSREGDYVSVRIKNYPRRNYLSRADCRRKTDGMSVDGGVSQFTPERRVSYLGWNVRGLVAEVIKPETNGPANKDPAGSPAESGNPGAGAGK